MQYCPSAALAAEISLRRLEQSWHQVGMALPSSAISRGCTFLLAVAPLIALLACKSSETCRATLDYQGKVGPGAGTTKAKATRGACWKYCGDHDPNVEAKWQAWKASGGKSRGSKFSDLSDEPQLKQVELACEEQCLRDIAAGKGKVTFDSSCK